MILIVSLLVLASVCYLIARIHLFLHEIADANMKNLETTVEIYMASRRDIVHLHRVMVKQATELNEIKRLVSFHKPKVFIGEESMDGKNLMIAVVRPELTAADVKSVVYRVYVNDSLCVEKTTPAEVETKLFKVPKGTMNMQVGVHFIDSSDNIGAETFSEKFNAIDTIPPNAPGSVTVTFREETAEDSGDDVTPVEVPNAEPESEEAQD